MWNSLMFAELRSLRERFATFLTEKWSFASMGTDVIVQRGRSCKCARAVTALEWLIASMSDNMRAHFIGLGERFRAIITRVWSQGHARAHVYLEHVFLGEWLITLTAFHQAQLWAIGQAEPLVIIVIFDNNSLFFQSDRLHIAGPLSLCKSVPHGNGAVGDNRTWDLAVPRNSSVIRWGWRVSLFFVYVVTWRGNWWFPGRCLGRSVWGDRWLTWSRRRTMRCFDWSFCKLCLTLGC